MKKRIFIIIVVLVLIIGGCFLYKFIKKQKTEKVISNITKTMQEIYDSNNYYYEYTSNNEAYGKEYRQWVMGNNVAYTLEDSMVYIDYTSNKFYLVNFTDNTYSEQDNSIDISSGKAFLNLPSIASSNKENDFLKHIKEFKTEKNGDKICYKITYENETYKETTYFDKDTLIPLESIQVFTESEEEIKVKYNIIKGNVKDSDVTFNFDDFTKLD